LEIIIVRHADPDYTRDTITPLGEEQARLLARRLSKLKLDDIFMSPYGRARKTAAALTDLVRGEPVVLPWLRELAINGCPWGRPHNDYLKSGEFGTVHRWKNSYFAGPETAEALLEVSTGLDELLAHYGYERHCNLYRVVRSSNKRIAFFCHYATTLAILSHLVNSHLPLAFAHLEVAVASLTWVVFHEDDGEAVPRLRTLGDVSHLGERVFAVDNNMKWS